MELRGIATGLVIGIILGVAVGYTTTFNQSISLQNQVKDLQTQIKNLKNEADKVPGLQQQLISITSEKNNLQTQLATVQAQIDILQAQVNVLENDKNQLQMQITNASDLISKQQIEILSLQSSLRARVGSLPGYEVGVDYHAYGEDFLHTAFITMYHKPEVRQEVRRQLQGIADRGATIICTNIWFVNEPGTTDFGETYRVTFPMSDQEQANLHAYAQDVAIVVGHGGNRLRLDIALRWLGSADYLRGSPTTGLGWEKITASEFTARLESTTDRVIKAVSNVVRPDGVPVVDTIYLDGEVMIGAKANQEWFLLMHYPRFVSQVSKAGFQPSVYFIVETNQTRVFDDDYVDELYSALDGHISMFWMYRSLRFMVDNGLYIPSRIDFSCFFQPSAPYSHLLERILDDADATLTSLGAPRLYGVAETHYYIDENERLVVGQAFSEVALKYPSLRRVCFWTTPDGGGPGVNIAYPFAFEDFLPLSNK